MTDPTRPSQLPPARPTSAPTQPGAEVGPALPPAPSVVVAEPRQRWRLTFTRDPVPADAVGRPGLDAWQEMLAASGLPLAGLEAGGAGRARIAFAAPLPAMATGEAELADLWLLSRLPRWTVREALVDRLPAAHRWIGAEDVWLGAPALAGRVVAADWRIVVDDVPVETRERLAVAAGTLHAARTLPRTRVKGTTEKRYDLRPLLARLSVEPAASVGGTVVRMRTRIDPELGSGRPEEVVAALAEAADCTLAIGAITRERLLLIDDPATPRSGSPPVVIPRRPVVPRRPVASVMVDLPAVGRPVCVVLD